MQTPIRITLLTLSCSLACVTNEAPEAWEDVWEEYGEGEEELRVCEAAAPAHFALTGEVLLPDGATLEGSVIVRDGKIESVLPQSALLPAGIPVIQTGGVISPGLFDLHNHVTYNFLPTWKPSRLFQNRYEWQKNREYAAAVKTPYGKVRSADALCQAQTYGELRALVGGTTAIQGSLGSACQNGWARNVEAYNFCEDRVRTWVLSIASFKPEEATRMVSQFNSGATRAFITHLGEGVDALSREELASARQLGLVSKELVAIHGTAFGRTELNELAANGMGLVWSPRSNLALYGATLDVPAARAAGVRLALAPDWSPSGSANLLAELKLADSLNRTRFGNVLTDDDLFNMVTRTPAEIAGLGMQLGQIAPGFTADLMVVRRHTKGPSARRTLIESRPQDVLLTLVEGKAWFGESSFLDRLGRAGTYETVDACGASRGLVVRNPGVSEHSLQSLRNVFTTAGVTHVAPLFDCNP
ncbi:MAG: amidohydrolase family protein [Myxococcaceae bacterium]